MTSNTQSTARSSGRPTPRVAIIGAGMGGIAVAVNLIQRGIESFVMFEKNPGPGGSWWANDYPGAECDVPSTVYSYSFRVVPWKRTHGTRSQIQTYLDETIDEFGFRDRVRLGLGVERAEWIEQSSLYLVTTSDGEVHEFDVVVSSVGMLNVPNESRLPGLDDFLGTVVHSSRWTPDIDVEGKRIAVVGAGASAAQIVPALAPRVADLVAIQREPAWVMPKNSHDYTPEEARAKDRPEHQAADRRAMIDLADSTLKAGQNIEGEAAQRSLSVATKYIAEALDGRPDLIEALTPSYPMRCKRMILSDVYLQAFTQPHVRLVRGSVVSATPKGVVDSSGEEHQVDVLVLATGFQARNYLSTLEVIGTGGVHLHDVWDGNPTAFLGLMVPGFPNFYMTYGPNTHGTIVSHILELQAQFIAKNVRRLVRRKGSSIEVRRSWFDRFESELRKGLGRIEAYTGGCHSMYITESGKNVTQWPWSHRRYEWWTKLMRVPATRLRRDSERAGRGAAAPREPEHQRLKRPTIQLSPTQRTRS